MKLIKTCLLFGLSAFAFMKAPSQNAMINILTRNAGVVKKGKTIFLEITINNTTLRDYIGIYKIRTQISVPSEIVSIDTVGHVLPTGWKIISNNGSTINLSNGMDMMAASDARTLLIAIRGKKAGGPSTISAQLTFSNGYPPGTEPGSLQGDNPADNSSTSTIRVILK